MVAVLKKGYGIIAEYLGALPTNGDRTWIYRGHSNDSWTAKASVYRSGNSGINDLERLNKWRPIADRLAPSRPMADIEYLVLAQHYGMPTALLDWTRNPLIALFFAVSGDDYKADGCVLGATKEDFYQLGPKDPTYLFATARKKPLLFDCSAMNIRAKMQDSLMSLHTEAEPDAATTVIYTIDKMSKWAVRLALDTLAISTERVYSDIALAAASLREDFEMDDVFK